MHHCPRYPAGTHPGSGPAVAVLGEVRQDVRPDAAEVTKNPALRAAMGHVSRGPMLVWTDVL